MTTTEHVPAAADGGSGERRVTAGAATADAAAADAAAPATTAGGSGGAAGSGDAVDEREARQVAEAARETEWGKPSFGKELFLGRFRLDLIDPFPAATSDPQRAERSADFFTRLEEYLRREVDGAAIERDGRIPDEVITGLAELGAFGMKIETRYGGMGLSYLDYCRAIMLVSSVSPAVAALLSAHQSIGVPQPVRQFGTEEQKRRLLPRVAAGEISAFLLTEPDVGSDPARLHTSAVVTDDGDYLLNGVKLWATNGTIASLLVVMAKVPPVEGHRGGITAFVVEADSPGVTVERRNAFLGLRGLENSVTRFHDVRVPRQNVIGREGQGLKIALTTLNTGRLSLPATCVGAGKWALNVAREWTAERVQWGLPIAKHEAIASKLAFIAASTYGMEAMLELSCRLADDGGSDIRIEAALVKLYASELSWRIADELLQIRGGRGYETAESLAARGERPIGAEQLLRDLRINRVFEGSTEIMHLFVAREAVDAHLAVAGDIIDPRAALGRKAKAVGRAGAFYARWLPTLTVGRGQIPGGYAEFGPLAGHLRYVERASRKLARETFYGMARWQGKLERRQGFLGRLVDIGAELFAMSATCVKARAERHNRPESVELADIFCQQARLRAEALFAALWDNADAAEVRVAKRVVNGRYLGLEEGIVAAPRTGEWVATWQPGPSAVDDVRRRVPTPSRPAAEPTRGQG